MSFTDTQDPEELPIQARLSYAQRLMTPNQGPGQGFVNLGNSLIGALLARKGMAAQQSLIQDRQAKMAALLKGDPSQLQQNVAADPYLSRAVGPALLQGEITANQQANAPITPYQKAQEDLQRQQMAQQAEEFKATNAREYAAMHKPIMNPYGQLIDPYSGKVLGDQAGANGGQLPLPPGWTKQDLDQASDLQNIGGPQALARMYGNLGSAAQMLISKNAMERGANGTYDATGTWKPNAPGSAPTPAGSILNARQSYKGRQDYITGLAKDTPNSPGGIVKSAGAAISHLDMLAQAAGAMQNGDVRALNALNNRFQAEFGIPAPTTFDALKPLVAGEMNKFITANPSVSGANEVAAGLHTAGSPQQIAGALNGFLGLAVGQLRSARQQASAFKAEDQFDAALTPRAKQLLTSVKEPQPFTGQIGQQSGPIRIQGPEDYAKVAPGAQYIDPQGNMRTKKK